MADPQGSSGSPADLATKRQKGTMQMLLAQRSNRWKAASSVAPTRSQNYDSAATEDQGNNSVDGDDKLKYPRQRSSSNYRRDLYLDLQKGSLQDATIVMRRHLANSRKWTLDPRSKRMQYWDLVTLVALLFTAIVTPYEICLLPSVSSNMADWDALFWLNRLVDLVFVLDIGINFMTAYREEPYKGGNWVFSHKKIARNYLHGWFFIDLISIIPFDLLAMYLDSMQSMGRLRVVRIIRLLRLLKLFRILRASRIFKRWETSISIRYSMITLIEFLLLMLVVSHWLACIWALLPHLEGPNAYTWLDRQKLRHARPVDIYVVSLYWAVMTLSSIGYGDVVAVNTVEYLVAVLCMFVGASVWAYVVGTACGVAATLDPHGTMWKQTMDQLNYFMEDSRLPAEMRRRLREYFTQTKHLLRASNYNQLIMSMSPQLQGEVALQCHSEWLDKVWCFKNPHWASNQEHKDFIVQVAVRMETRVYAPKELIPGGELHILHRGLVAKCGHIMGNGAVWGEDMILDTEYLKQTYAARALTYVEVSRLSMTSLEIVLEVFPNMQRQIRNWKIRLALRRAFIAAAKEIKQAEWKEKEKDNASSLIFQDVSAPPEVHSVPRDFSDEIPDPHTQRLTNLEAKLDFLDTKVETYHSNVLTKVQNMTEQVMQLAKFLQNHSTSNSHQEMKLPQASLQLSRQPSQNVRSLPKLDSVHELRNDQWDDMQT